MINLRLLVWVVFTPWINSKQCEQYGDICNVHCKQCVWFQVTHHCLECVNRSFNMSPTMVEGALHFKRLKYAPNLASSPDSDSDSHPANSDLDSHVLYSYSDLDSDSDHVDSGLVPAGLGLGLCTGGLRLAFGLRTHSNNVFFYLLVFWSMKLQT